MNILVTGGAGFIGSNIVEHLLELSGTGIVRVLDNLSTGFMSNIEPFMSNPRFEFFNGDIRNFEDCRRACKGMDYVLHEAALGSVPRSIDDPLTTNAVNITGFVNVLTAAKESRVKRFIYASSSSVYGDSQDSPKKETSTGKPLSPYGVTKQTNELYAHVFSKVYGLQIIGLRYFNVFGPRQNPEGAYAAVIPLFIRSLIKNEPPTINGDGSQTRDFTYVKNVVSANLKALMANSGTNQVYNIALGEQTTLNEVWDLLQSISGKRLTPGYGPAREGDIRNSLADIEKAKTLLDYVPSVRIKEGLIHTYNWFLRDLTL